MSQDNKLPIEEYVKNMTVKEMSGILSEQCPIEEILNANEEAGRRNRVYNGGTTLIAMIITATQQDKSLQNTVNIISDLHSKNIEKVKEAESALKRAKATRKRSITKDSSGKRIRIAKSKTKEISTNTAAFSKARDRLSMKLVETVFEASGDFDQIQLDKSWKGMDVYIADGTYLQMQDSEELQRLYGVKSGASETGSYPQALLQVIIEQGSGAVKHFELGNRLVSELELTSKLIPKLKPGSLLIADDLYNSYALMSLLLSQGAHFIVPGKRARKYTVKEQIAEGDEIVAIKQKNWPAWLDKSVAISKSLLLRRVEFPNRDNPKETYTIWTSILDKSIKSEEIVEKYFSRWDIETGIREIKTLMDINIIRAKKPDIVIKEVYTSLTAYNIIKKVIAKTAEKSGFSPKADIVQKHDQVNKAVLMDKKGRVYSRWSTGRPRKVGSVNYTPDHTAQAGKKLSEKN